MFMRACFQPFADPCAHSRVLNVHEFRADRVGINSLETREHVAQDHRPIIEEEFRRNAKIEIRFSKSELAQTEQWILRSLLRERIDPRNRMPKRAICVDETKIGRASCRERV